MGIKLLFLCIYYVLQAVGSKAAFELEYGGATNRGLANATSQMQRLEKAAGDFRHVFHQRTGKYSV
jgi:hypothetical protein